MKCRFCGNEVTPTQRFCLNCGMTLKRVPNNSSFDGSPSRRHEKKNTQRRPASKKNVHGPDSIKKYNTYMKDKARRTRQEKLRKIRFRRTVLIIILLAIVVSVISAVVAFNKTRETSLARSNPEVTAAPTIDPLAPDVPVDIAVVDDEGNVISSTASPAPKASASPTPKPAVGKVKDGYTGYKDNVSEIVCPYPSNYEKSDVTSTETKVSVTDGSAEMRINTSKATKQDTAQSLMKTYSDGIGVTPSSSDASDGIYTISFVRNGKFNHRAGVVYENRHIYYDFSCPEKESGNSSYTELISYADNFLKEQIKALKEDN